MLLQPNANVVEFTGTAHPASFGTLVDGPTHPLGPQNAAAAAAQWSGADTAAAAAAGTPEGASGHTRPVATQTPP
jgi:hypothetical protein